MGREREPSLLLCVSLRPHIQREKSNKILELYQAQQLGVSYAGP